MIVPNTRSIKTAGEFEYEVDVERIFDETFERLDLFYVEKEVRGRIFTDFKMIGGTGVRLDRLLLPKKDFIESGWTFGPIAVELKRSGQKIGHALNQIIDYQKSIFISKRLLDSRILPIMFFLFPVSKIKNELASILAQQWIGTMDIKQNKYENKIDAFLGEVRILMIDLNDRSKIEFAKQLPGKKYGSR